MNAELPQTHPAILDSGESRQITRRRLFTAHFPAYPGFVMGRNSRVSAHSKFKRFVPRAERRRLARAFAAGEWNKRYVMAMAASVV